MALEDSAKQHDLIRHLADTLVENEVMGPMNKIGWGHGTPPAPDYGTTPPPEGAPAVTPAAKPAETSGQPGTTPTAKPATTVPATANTPVDLLAQMESLRDPTTGLILGKYKEPMEAIKGVGHAVSMAKVSFSQRDAAVSEAAKLREENERLRTQHVTSPVTTPGQPTVSAASRADVDAAQARLDAVLASVVENGGIFDEESSKAYGKAQRELSRAEGKAAAEEALASREGARTAEQEKWAAVDTYMKDKYPDSLNFTQEIGLYIQSNPLLQEAVNALCAQGKEQKATELAWTEYDKVRSGATDQALRADAEAKETELAAKEQVRQEHLTAARKDAGVIKGSTGGQGVHENTGGSQPTQEEIEAAAVAMRRMGSAPGTAAAAKWRELTIGRSLDPAIFGS